MSKKKKEETTGDVVVADDAAADPEPKVRELQNPVVARGLRLVTFLENYKVIDGHPVGSGFRRWCELEDPTLFMTRKSDEEWRDLFEKFVNREVI